MFPYQINNGFGNNGFPYLVNPELFRTMYSQADSYIPQHQFYPNHIPTHPGQYNYFPLINHRPFLNERRIHNIRNDKPYNQKRKRITKKLFELDLRKQIRQHYKQYKAKSKTFKYFDPSRAPPITSLRNKFQIQLDSISKDKNLQTQKSQQQFSKENSNQNIKKLQILLEEPDLKDYPFLICKKRKYYRNLKRRYSVAYFQQRAHYILNKLPIPPQLQPKNKIRKSRSIVKDQNGDIIQQESLSYEESEQQNSQSVQKQFVNEPNHQSINYKRQQNIKKEQRNQNEFFQNAQKVQEI